MTTTDRSGFPPAARAAVAAAAGALPRRLIVEIDDSIIDSAGWRAVDLTGLGSIVRGSRHVTARFGTLALGALNDNAEDAGAGPPPGAIDGEAAQSVAEAEPPAAPRPLARVYRLRPHAGPGGAVLDVERLHVANDEAGEPRDGPPLVMPLPADDPIGWRTGGGAAIDRRHQGIDRTSVPLLIGLMVLAWLTVVGIGVYKGMTPGSGAPINWRD